MHDGLDYTRRDFVKLGAGTVLAAPAVTGLVCAAGVIGEATDGAAGRTGPAGGPSALPPAGQLPLVIPHPQAMRSLGPQRMVLGDDGRVLAETTSLEKGPLFEETAGVLERALQSHHLRKGSQPPVTTIVLTTRAALAGAAGPSPMPAWTPQESAALARSDQAYVIRMEPQGRAKVWIVGASPLGVYYGAATLVQLMAAAGPGRVVLPYVEVQDFPDTPGRMCANWVLTWDWEINGYDWGDGLEAFLARCRRKIDLCARYKVNRVRFLGGRISPGPPYMSDRYAKLKCFALELNRYARRKGVALQFSSSSWGIDYCGWGTTYHEPWILNRESYPDGRVYACVGGTVGGCLSNEALIERIAARQEQLVRDVEPGSIYLHQIDAARYAELTEIWKTRCPRCRRRFPDDEPYSARGYAGAVAGLYNRLAAGLKSVRNPESGYDASRDLEIVFASPGYSYWTEDDAQWDKDLKYFAEIGRQLQYKRNVQITFREQYHRLDNRGLRIEEMSRALAEVGWPRAMFVFAAQGADFLDSANMFVSSPVLTETFRGAGTLYNFNGHVHGELQVLANANYAWNHRAPGAVDPRQFPGDKLRQEASRYSSGACHSDYLFGPFLPLACAALYGQPAAAPMAAFYRLERQKGPILPCVAWIDAHYRDATYDWRGQADRNLQAKALVDQAAATCETPAKADLCWLSRCLEVSARLCRLCDTWHRKQVPPAKLDALAAELLSWLEANFRFEITEPDGGDPGLWKGVVGHIRQAAAQG
jgi:hypothetical protein